MSTLEARLGDGCEGFDQPTLKAASSASSASALASPAPTAQPAAAAATSAEPKKTVRVTKDSHRVVIPLLRKSKVNEFIYSELMDLNEEDEEQMNARKPGKSNFLNDLMYKWVHHAGRGSSSGKKRKQPDEDYDADDPFINDEEVDTGDSRARPKLGGFYVNKGSVEVEHVLPMNSSDDESESDFASPLTTGPPAKKKAKPKADTDKPSTVKKPRPAPLLAASAASSASGTPSSAAKKPASQAPKDTTASPSGTPGAPPPGEAKKPKKKPAAAVAQQAAQVGEQKAAPAAASESQPSLMDVKLEKKAAGGEMDTSVSSEAGEGRAVRQAPSKEEMDSLPADVLSNIMALLGKAGDVRPEDLKKLTPALDPFLLNLRKAMLAVEQSKHSLVHNYLAAHFPQNVKADTWRRRLLRVELQEKRAHVVEEGKILVEKFSDVIKRSLPDQERADKERFEEFKNSQSALDVSEAEPSTPLARSASVPHGSEASPVVPNAAPQLDFATPDDSGSHTSHHFDDAHPPPSALATPVGTAVGSTVSKDGDTTAATSGATAAAAATPGDAPKSKFARFRHQYVWSEEARALLRDVCTCHMKELEYDSEINRLNGARPVDFDEAIKDFFRDVLQPLWPKGWITINDLKNVGMPEYKFARKRTTSEGAQDVSALEKKIKENKAKPKASGAAAGASKPAAAKQGGSPKKTAPAKTERRPSTASGAAPSSQSQHPAPSAQPQQPAPTAQQPQQQPQQQHQHQVGLVPVGTVMMAPQYQYVYAPPQYHPGPYPPGSM